MVASVKAKMANLSGKISRVKFLAEDTGYAIAYLETDDFDETTIVGTMPDIAKGMPVELEGEWIEHAKYGKQFKFTRYHVPVPDGEYSTIAYLSTLKHVKESTARAMWQKFGDRIFDILDNTPYQLTQIKGIGDKTLDKILGSYQQTKGMRQLIAFLHGLGVSAGYASKIYREYGDGAIASIKQNPYRLAGTVRGFGFKRADEVARGMGVPVDSDYRIEAAVLDVLRTSARQQGHCFLENDDLYMQACELLFLPNFAPSQAMIERVERSMRSVAVPENRRTHHEEIGDVHAIYLYSTWKAERELAQSLKALAGAFEKPLAVADWIVQYEILNGIQLADGQKSAIAAVADHKMVVMTGGAGVGKSSTARAVVQFWHAQGLKIVACAPTGKAAQRIKESTGLQEASTIHRLLGWEGDKFKYHRANPIPGDAFLIDEASMMDLKLANSLFAAIPRHASVMIVGDVNQLPSVGAGNVLRDVINSEQVPVVRLTQVFRQAESSRIIKSSHQINAGQFPDLEQIGLSTDRPFSDALWLKCSQDKIKDAMSWLLSEKLPQLGWSFDDIQCLSPQHKGDVGNIALNQMVQDLWNPSKQNFRGFRLNDRVIQISNNYDLKIFNGDIGKIVGIDPEDAVLLVAFPDSDSDRGFRVVNIESGDIGDLMLAYSVSVHKAQGSEFPAVVIPVTMQHYMGLQRNLLYTGLTRAKKLIVLVGEEKAIAHAVRTQKISQRNTALAYRMQ